MATKEVETVKAKIARYCAYQERCRWDVRNKLFSMKEAQGMDWNEIIGWLEDQGFLNEERFLRAYCRGKFRQNAWGKYKIEAALKQKGFREGDIRAAFDAEITEEEYEEVKTRIRDEKGERILYSRGF